MHVASYINEWGAYNMHFQKHNVPTLFFDYKLIIIYNKLF